MAVINGCCGCYCGNCSELANSCNVTTGGVSYYSRNSPCYHHHYKRRKLIVLSACSLKSKVEGICYCCVPQSTGSPAECVCTFQGMLDVASVICSEQQNENKELLGFGFFDRCQQIKKMWLVGLIVLSQMKLLQTKFLITAAPLDQVFDRAQPR